MSISTMQISRADGWDSSIISKTPQVNIRIWPLAVQYTEEKKEKKKKKEKSFTLVTEYMPSNLDRI